MKKWIFLFALALFFGCAKNNPEFVPLSLNWFEYQGDLAAIDSSYKPATVDSSFEETCLISMTRALIESKNLRECEESAQEYNVQYFGILVDGKSVLEFRGQSASIHEILDMEKEPLPLNKSKNCTFKARCDGKTATLID